MQKLLSKRLVGIGLVVALLAFAVPALAQNQWTPQTNPSPFATPVTALGMRPTGTVDAVTYGGGITHGGTAGFTYYSTDKGVNFTQRTAPAPVNDDYTAVLWDGTGYGYIGSWNSGLWQYDSGSTNWVKASAGIPWINQHVSALALDPTGGAPHTLYFATWGGGIYSYNFNTSPVPGDFAQIPNYPTAPAALFIHDIVVVPASCPSSPLTIYAATDGYGLLKGVKNCSSGVWSWTQVFTNDMYVDSVAYDGSNLLVGTKSSGIFWSGDGGSTWTASSSSPAITMPVTDLVLSSAPNFYFASTDGQGVYRYDSSQNAWRQINNGFAGADLGNLHVNAIAYDAAGGYLYAGTGDTATPGTTGDVYTIHLVAPVLTFASPLSYTVGDTATDSVGVTTINQSPQNWTAMVTSGQLHPDLSVSVNNTPYPPVVTVGGTFTTDGCYTGTLSVYDSLWNRVDLPFSYTVNPNVDFTVSPDLWTQLGTVNVFTDQTTGITGTPSYAWTFGDGGTSTDQNPTHIYSAPGPKVVTLTVTDSSPAGNGGCGSVSNSQTYTVHIFGQLSIAPTATQVGSGAQFQFDANAFGGDTSCSPSGIPPYADAYTYAWTIKDANTGTVLFTSADQSPVYTFAYTGDFIATVTVTDCSGVSQTASCSLNYNGPMSATIASLLNPAPANHSVLFTGSAQSTASGATYTFNWDFGDGNTDGPNTGTATVPSTTSTSNSFASPGTYTVKMTVDDGFAHTTVVTMQQQVYAEFTGVNAVFNPDPNGGPCQFTSDQTMSVTLTPVGGLAPYHYSIDWGDGSVTTTSPDPADASPQTFNHTYAVGGPYVIHYYVTDSGNVQVTQQGQYLPGFTVVAPMTSTTLTANGMPCVNPQIVAPGGTANITLLATPNAGSGTYVYDWDFTNNGTYDASTTSPTNSVIHTYGIPGGQDTAQYTAKVRVTDVGACAAPVVTKTVTFTLFRPLAVVGTPAWQQQCGSQVVTFDASGDFQGGIAPYTYLWNFDDGVSVTTTTPYVTHDFATTYGTRGYDVQLTVTDSASPNCGDPANTVNIIGGFHIQVVDPITVMASATPMSGCSPLAVAFSSTGTVGGGFPGTDLSYAWDFGDGGSSTSANPNHTYTTPGNYWVTLTVTSNVVGAYSCSYQIPTQIKVYGGLTSLSFTQTETSGYLPLPDTFTTTFAGDNAGPVTLTYNWGDGTPNTVVNNAVSPDITTHTFEIHGAHTVTVTASSTCGSPMSQSRVIQVLEPSALDVTTTTLVNGVAGNAGTSPLTVSFGCVPTGGVSPYTFYWNFGDGVTSTDQNPTHTYTTAGTYNAYVTVTDSWPSADGGPKTKTANVTIIVYDPISATATANVTSGGTPLDVNFTAAATGGNGTYSYAWNFGDGATSTMQNPSHTYNTAGTYYAYVTVTDSATNSATSNNVVIHAYNPMTVTLSGTPNQGTAPLSVAFTALATGGDGNYTYKWDFNNDGVIDQTTTQGTVNHVYNSAMLSGAAKVTVTDGRGVSNSATTPVTVWAPLTASIASSATTGTTPLSVNFTSTVAGGDGAYVYHWNFGDGTTASTANPTKVFSNAGNFSVTLTVTDGSSHTVLSNTINMTVYAPLTVSASATPTNLTVGDSSTFTAVASGGDGHYSYAWVFGDGSTGTGATANHVYTTYHAGDFTWMAHVTVTDTAGHSVTSSDIAIVVKPVPPTITYAKKQTNPFRIVLFGTNFQNGCTATINGVPVDVKYKNGGKIKLKHCKSLCPKHVAVNIVVTNPDGGVSAPFQFAR